MDNHSPISAGLYADLGRPRDVSVRTPAPHGSGESESLFTVVRDAWEPRLHLQGGQTASPHAPLPAQPSGEALTALDFLGQFQATLSSLSYNRRVASFMANQNALQAMAVRLPRDRDGNQLIEKLGLPALVASVSCNALPTFMALCDRHGPNLLAVASANSAWLVRVAASRGGDFAQVLLRQLPTSQWHVLLAEDNGSGFRSLLKHRQAELLTMMFAATRDEHVMALLEQSPRAVGEAMRSPKMVQVLTPVLSRVNISLS